MSKTTTQTKTKPTYQEDYDRAAKLIGAYAEMKKELEDHKLAKELEMKPINDKWKPKVDRCTESMKAAEVELSEIGLRNKKKFVKNRLTFTVGYLLLSKTTVVEMLKDVFSWPKFLRKFPEYAEADFNIKELKQAFTDGDLRPRIMEYGIDLKQEDSIKVKITDKLDDAEE